jgi:hypothetical protein
MAPTFSHTPSLLQVPPVQVPEVLTIVHWPVDVSHERHSGQLAGHTGPPLHLFSSLAHQAGWPSPEHAAALPVLSYWTMNSHELLLPFETQFALEAGAAGLFDMHSKTPSPLTRTGVHPLQPPSIQK